MTSLAEENPRLVESNQYHTPFASVPKPHNEGTAEASLLAVPVVPIAVPYLSWIPSIHRSLADDVVVVVVITVGLLLLL